MSSFAQSTGPKIKDIERLVVYVTPNTTFTSVIDFKDFILSESDQEITLNNGKKIKVPIVETNIPPVIFEDDEDSVVSTPSTASVHNDNYLIRLNSRFCFNSEASTGSRMSARYAIKAEPDFIEIIALTTHNGVEVPAFLITITFWSDMSNQTENYSLWVEALCSDQENNFLGASSLLRLILALCKKFNRTATPYKIVNSYLEALPEVEKNYLKQGYVETTDFTTPIYTKNKAMKRDISPQSPVAESMASKFVNAKIGNEEEEEKILNGLDSGKITWVIDRIGDRRSVYKSVKSSKSMRTGKRKPKSKSKPRKSRKYTRSSRSV